MGEIYFRVAFFREVVGPLIIVDTGFKISVTWATLSLNSRQNLPRSRQPEWDNLAARPD